MEKLEKFLEFNGRRLAVLNADGQWWIAVKPICEALGVNYNRQFQNIKEDEILSGVFANQQMHDSSNRVQEMLCLPEKYVYGWLFSVRSESPGLADFKRQCYDVLYNHFHGTLTGRLTKLQQRMDVDVRIADLEQQLLESPQYTEIQQLKRQKTALGSSLRQLDRDLLAGQLALKL